jgi:hypothetical protein
MADARAELLRLIQRIRNRWRAMTALRAWGLAAGSAALVLGLAVIAQRLLQPEGGALIALWMTAMGGALATLAWFVVPLRRVPSTRNVARFIEE